MVIVFDLDDTLYEEMTYVRSGFKSVARFLNLNFNVSASESFEFMMKDLNVNGRGLIFNNILERYGLLSSGNIQKCLSVYRMHDPNISLPQTSIDCISRFHEFPKYIVTDGNKIVQHKKVLALNLYSQFKKVFITHRYGVHNAKPSPYCFNKIKELEKTTSRNIIYIGDNSKKDFVGIKPLGFKTIRVLTGNYKDNWYSKEKEAHITIGSLSELTIDLIKSF